MNYFPFHIGDYAAHTAHLEPMEDLAYRRLLDLYYLRETPIPADIQATAKLVRLRSFAADVESVLNEFFKLTDSGWKHGRCDTEIAKMQDRKEATEERDEHENTRQKKHRERRSAMFAQLTEVGVYPAWNAKTGELEKLIAEHCSQPVTAPDTPVTRQITSEDAIPVTAPDTPVTQKTSQHGQPATAIPTPTPTPIPKNKNTSSPPVGGCKRFEEFWATWPRGDRKQDKVKCAEKWRRCNLDAMADAILADIEVKRGTDKWRDGFVEAPLVYLNGKRWEDGVSASEARVETFV